MTADVPEVGTGDTGQVWHCCHTASCAKPHVALPQQGDASEPHGCELVCLAQGGDLLAERSLLFASCGRRWMVVLRETLRAAGGFEGVMY